MDGRTDERTATGTHQTKCCGAMGAHYRKYGVLEKKSQVDGITFSPATENKQDETECGREISRASKQKQIGSMLLEKHCLLKNSWKTRSYIRVVVHDDDYFPCGLLCTSIFVDFLSFYPGKRIGSSREKLN